MPVLVPPGGFAGFAQQTPATQNLFQRAGRIGGRTTQRRRRRKNGATKLRAPKRRAAAKRRNGRARLVKGSPAARAHMAKLRRMRKRK